MVRHYAAVIFLCSSTAASAQAVPLDRWLQHMRTGLPVALCAKSSPIGVCFSRSVEDCEESARSAVRSCIAEMEPKLPKSIQMPEEGRKYGSDIGNCSANVYATVNQAFYKETEQCVAVSKSFVSKAEPK